MTAPLAPEQVEWAKVLARIKRESLEKDKMAAINALMAIERRGP